MNVYRIIVLLCVLYGCETWSLTLGEERRLRVFEIGVLRRIFWPRWDEEPGERRKLHNEELNDLYCSPNIFRIIKSRRMRWAGHVARVGERRVEYSVLVGKPEEKRPLGRPRRRWEDNIKVDLQEEGWGHGLDGAGSRWGQVAGTGECGNEPSCSLKCGEFIDWLKTGWLLKKQCAAWSK